MYNVCLLMSDPPPASTTISQPTRQTELQSISLSLWKSFLNEETLIFCVEGKLYNANYISIFRQWVSPSISKKNQDHHINHFINKLCSTSWSHKMRHLTSRTFFWQRQTYTIISSVAQWFHLVLFRSLISQGKFHIFV